MKRTPICFLALASLSIAQELPITRMASITYQVGGLEKARQFYTGIKGLEEPFKVPGGASFKLNDDQYLEFIEGPSEGFRLVRLSMLTPDIDRLRSMLLERKVAAGEIETGAGGNRRCTVKDPGRNQIDFVQYTPASNQWKSRGKALGANRATDHLLHAGIASGGESLQLPFYTGKLGFREQLRGGPDKDTAGS
jgi:catechol 2,3-dioxygenase-like lactoylglutathione lyase family enzyme